MWTLSAICSIFKKDFKGMPENSEIDFECKLNEMNRMKAYVSSF